MPRESVAKRASGWLLAAAALVYAALLAWGSKLHTFWRDEAEVWIVARDSHGWMNLLHNARYEGHPPGWYFVLYGVTRFTANPAWMKLPNFLFAVAAAVMILSATRVALWVRLGLVFSYFMLFEYAVIDRNYMMGIMLLLAALMLMRSGKGVFRVPVMLGMAALTSLPALVVAVCFYPLHLLPVWREDRSGIFELKRVLAGVLFAVCVLGAVAEARPPADSGLTLDSLPRGGMVRSIVHPFHDVAKAYLPMPALRVMFWDTNLIDGISPPLFTLIGVVLAVGLVFFFRQKAVRSFFVGASGLLLLQMVASRRTDARHVGWLFVVFVLAVLLREVACLGDAEEETSWRTWLLGGVLAVQVVAGIFAVSVSARHSFSGSKAAADFLREKQMDTLPIVFAPDYVGLAPLAYMQRPTAYYLERHAQGSIVVWNKEEHYARHTPSAEELKAASVDGTRPVLITEKPLSDEEVSSLGVQRLALFSGEIYPDHYFIYR